MTLGNNERILGYHGDNMVTVACLRATEVGLIFLMLIRVVVLPCCRVVVLSCCCVICAKWPAMFPAFAICLLSVSQKRFLISCLCLARCTPSHSLVGS